MADLGGDVMARAVLDIAKLLCVALEQRRAYWAEHGEIIKRTRVICARCGCLCWPDETCPGCRARRLDLQEAS